MRILLTLWSSGLHSRKQCRPGHGPAWRFALGSWSARGQGKGPGGRSRVERRVIYMGQGSGPTSDGKMGLETRAPSNIRIDQRGGPTEGGKIYIHDFHSRLSSSDCGAKVLQRRHMGTSPTLERSDAQKCVCRGQRPLPTRLGAKSLLGEATSQLELQPSQFINAKCLHNS